MANNYRQMLYDRSVSTITAIFATVPIGQVVGSPNGSRFSLSAQLAALTPLMAALSGTAATAVGTCDDTIYEIQRIAIEVQQAKKCSNHPTAGWVMSALIQPPV